MSMVSIPQGDRTLSVQLTVKEAMALTAGVRFWNDAGLAAGARHKVQEQLNRELLKANEKLDYATLGV